MPICKSLVENHEQIKKEVLHFCKDPMSLVDYPNYPIPEYKSIYENYWKAAPVSVFRDEYIELNGSPEFRAHLKALTENTRSKCPTLVDCIKEMEFGGHLANSFISRLLPGTVINPHFGWSNNWLRLHLGIVCDPECKITVGNESRTWEEGKLLAFYDGGNYPHSVRHDGTKERIIVSVDLNIKYIRDNYNEEI